MAVSVFMWLCAFRVFRSVEGIGGFGSWKLNGSSVF